MKKVSQLIIYFLLLLMLFSCAGPTTPFGALNFIKDRPSLTKNTHRNNQSSEVKISFTPPRQKWHKSSSLKITVEDPLGIEENPNVKVIYNGIDVTKSFVSLTKIVKNKKSVEYHIRSTRFLPSRDNNLEVHYYRPESSHPLQISYWKGPQCPIYSSSQLKLIANTDTLKKIRTSILKQSKIKGYNPNLIAALIAQESSFNPNAVSWAKAIGLTQITPLAEAEIHDHLKSWPKYPRLNAYPASIIKALIKTQKLTPHNEWRLNIDKSILGGIHYLDYLDQYWQKEDINPLINYTDLILASYNSGAYRVKKAIRKYGHHWTNSKKLREAKKYVGNIKSYCDEYMSRN